MLRAFARVRLLSPCWAIFPEYDQEYATSVHFRKKNFSATAIDVEASGRPPERCLPGAGIVGNLRK